MNDLSKVTRFEVIDHRPIKDERGQPVVKGRILVTNGIRIEASLQDDTRTLKIFITSDGSKPEEES